MKVLAIDVGGTAIKSALVHADGTIEDFRELATPSVIAEGILEATKGYSDYAAVGICTAGLVDYKKGIVIFSSAALGYHDNEPLAEEIGSVLGVPVLVGTDANDSKFVPAIEHGSSMAVEMEMLADCGIPALDVLKGATSLNADVFGMDNIGRIAPGKKADFILVKGRPDKNISDIRNIEKVFIGGEAVE